MAPDLAAAPVGELAAGGVENDFGEVKRGGCMRASISDSGIQTKRGQGDFPYVDLMFEAESETERALLRALRSGTVSFHVWTTGNASMRFRMPRAKQSDF